MLRTYIGIIFIYASMDKIHYPAEFSEAIAAYQILPYWSINAVAVALPWIELLCGFFLILGLRTRTAASIVGLLLSMFSIAILINLYRNMPIGCGCFDNVDGQITWWDVFRDIGWLMLIVQIFLFDKVYFFGKRRLGLRMRTGDGLSALLLERRKS
ncbi:MAG: DoxX family membrane protein [Deltaproteobacteria bacterium]|nr:DoxX family membrane protein [Deltaproteobacteria bacterium]MBW2661307.1 DoxX family membrane protein [Deltaproteobacteria bacterium]